MFESYSNEIRLMANVILSIVSSALLFKLMPKFKEMFLKADLKGTDLSKKEKYQM